MTIDLNEHMEKKKREKHIKAFNAIGDALDGLTVGTVLHILGAFTASVLDQMTEEDRKRAAMTFSLMLIGEETIQ
jgi:hypothetical protein